jgi:uncharacterized protein (PEP-CTERM system associated)
MPLLLLISAMSHAAQNVVVATRIGVISEYSDNITQASDDPTSSTVIQAMPGLNLTNAGQYGRMELDYQLQGVFYQTDALDDRAHHYLNAYIDYQFIPKRLTLFADTRIEPRAADIYETAIADTVTGGDALDEVYRYRSGFKWDQPVSPMAELHIGADVNRIDYQDNDETPASDGSDWFIHSQTTPQAESTYWDVNYQGSHRYSNDDSYSTIQSLNAQAGVALNKQFDLIVNSDWEEDISHSLDDGDYRFSTANAGPGIRWSPNAQNYLSLSYNFALNDDSQNYWGSQLRWQPTSRTEVTASYRKRYFGDSYAFSAAHRYRKVMTKLSYQESQSSFSRELFLAQTSTLRCDVENLGDLTQCSLDDGSPLGANERQVESVSYVGSQSNDVYLLKRADWLISRTATRSTTSLTLFGSNRAYLTGIFDEHDYGGDVSWVYRLSRSASLKLKALYRHVIDNVETAELTADEQQYRIEISDKTSRYVTSRLYYQYHQRDTDGDTSDYRENRIGVSMEYRF